MFENYDKENMFESIWNFPNNLKDAITLGDGIDLKNDYSHINNIVIAGMGGSAIGGDIVSVLENSNINIPYTVCRDYSIPGWVNSSSLVICSSYSGNTEETISCYKSAIKRKISPVIVSSGGYILDNAKKYNYDFVELPKGIQPRAAFGYSASLLLLAFVEIGIIDKEYNKQLFKTISSIKSKSNEYAKISNSNISLNLSKVIFNKFPIIYCTVNTEVVGFRFRCQLAENSKILSSHFVLPEQNHNEIEGFLNNDISNYVILWIKDKNDNNRTIKRINVTSKLLKNIKNQFIYDNDSDSLLERLFNLIYLFDWVSFYCAILHKTNPTPVKTILKLKSLMS